MKRKSDRLDANLLETTYRGAIDNIRELPKDKHETHSAYVARCWIDAFRSALITNNLEIIIKPKE